jgi:Skp family chaperone for outer membrane proteins
MKKIPLLSTLLVILLLGAVPPVRAATAPEKAEKVAARMLKSKESIDAASAQIDTTLKSMNDMAAAKGPDLKTRYSEFTKNVDKLESMAKTAKSNADKARKDRDAYLKKWASAQDQIQNEQLKEASKARRDELVPKIDALKDAFASVKETFTPFMQSLHDLELYLGNDLSERGIATATELMNKCNADGEKMKADLATATATYQQLAASLSPSAAK